MHCRATWKMRACRGCLIALLVTVAASTGFAMDSDQNVINAVDRLKRLHSRGDLTDSEFSAALKELDQHRRDARRLEVFEYGNGKSLELPIMVPPEQEPLPRHRRQQLNSDERNPIALSNAVCGPFFAVAREQSKGGSLWKTRALDGLRNPDAVRAGVSSEVARAIQRERCAVCEHFMSRLHLSGLDREASDDPRLEQRVNVVGLIPCDNSNTISNTASEFQREVQLQHVDGKKMCEGLRAHLGQTMTASMREAWEATVSALRIDKVESTGADATSSEQCFATAVEDSVNQMCGQLSCCDQTATIGCPDKPLVCQQCFDAVMDWGEFGEAISMRGDAGFPPLEKAKGVLQGLEAEAKTRKANIDDKLAQLRPQYEGTEVRLEHLSDASKRLGALRQRLLEQSKPRMRRSDAAARHQSVESTISEACLGLRRSFDELIVLAAKDMGGSSGAECHAPKLIKTHHRAMRQISPQESCTAVVLRQLRVDAQSLAESACVRSPLPDLDDVCRLVVDDALSANQLPPVAADEQTGAYVRVAALHLCKIMLREFEQKRDGKNVCSDSNHAHLVPDNEALWSIIHKDLLDALRHPKQIGLVAQRAKLAADMIGSGLLSFSNAENHADAIADLQDDLDHRCLLHAEHAHKRVGAQLNTLLFFQHQLVEERERLDTMTLDGFQTSPFNVASKAFWMRFVEEQLPSFAKSKYGISCVMRRKTMQKRCFKCAEGASEGEDGRIRCKRYGGALVTPRPASTPRWNPFALATSACSHWFSICAPKDPDEKLIYGLKNGKLVPFSRNDASVRPVPRFFNDLYDGKDGDY